MRVSIFCLILLFSISARGSNPSECEKQFVCIDHTIKEGETYSRILKKYVRQGTKIRSENKGVIKTLSFNKHIVDWRNLPKDKEVKLFILRTQVNAQLLNYKSSGEVVSKKEDLEMVNKEISLWAYYGATIGNYNELLSGQYLVDYSQTGPAQFGLEGEYQKKGNKFILGVEAQINYISAGKVNNSDLNKLNIPIEYFLVGFYKRRYKESNFHWFVDTELIKTSTFNLINVANRNDSLDTNDHLFGSLGLGGVYKLNLLKMPLTFKLAVGQSLFGMSDIGDFDSRKYYFKSTLSASKKLDLYFHYLRRKIEGETEVKVNRWGLGISYLIF